MSKDETSGADEGFLSRWSRLKQGLRNEPEATDAHAQRTMREAAVEQDRAPVPVKDRAAAFDPAVLPRIEDMTPSTPITDFLRQEVPEAMRRAALRQAWSLDPAIRDFVEVAENQYDWNVPGGAPGFGDLDPGTSIEKLLAQATGQIDALEEALDDADGSPAVDCPDLPPAADETAPSGAAGGAAEAGLASTLASTAGVEDGGIGGSASGDNAAGDVGTPAGTGYDPRVPTPRAGKHGGALPKEA